MAKSELPSKIPPQNIEAEQSVLGAILLDKDAILKVVDILNSENFYRDDHKLIYEIMLVLFEKRSPIDLVTLTNELETRKKLKEVGGAAYLSSLVNGVPSSAHVAKYAEIVRHKATLRRLIHASSTIIELGFNETADIAEVLDKAESTIFSISQKFTSDNFVPIKSVLEESFDRIDELHKNKGTLRGVPTGFKELDGLISGLQKSDLVIIAARPSMGKTSFVLNIAEYAAVKHKVPVGLFSLEQSRDQIVDRLLCMQAGVDSWRLRKGELAEDDFRKIGEAMGELAEAPIFIDDSPMLSVMEIRAKARRLQVEHGLGLVIIDYLQLMEGRSSHGNDANRVQEVSEISRSLKALARELNIPVVALSQLSRAVEQRDRKIPQLSDLRESGSIEQDADVVMFIYREDYYNKETENKNIADILVRKHRNGPIGDIKLYFIPEQTKFGNLDHRKISASG
ncbi:MAG: replicative DNA helicase [bacterium]|nr:replicative DNA helicase [bacterium]